MATPTTWCSTPTSRTWASTPYPHCNFVALAPRGQDAKKCRKIEISNTLYTICNFLVFLILQHIYCILAQPPVHYTLPCLEVLRCRSVVGSPHCSFPPQGRSAPRATRCRATATTTPACTAAPAPRAGTDTSATARKPPSRAPPAETVSLETS